MKTYDSYKDSGTQWIGEIPEHWEIVKIKYIVDVKDGTHDSPNYVEEEIYPLITSKDLRSGDIDFSDCKYISEEDYRNIRKRSNADFGDIIMPMIGTVGNPVLINTQIPFAIKNVALFKTSNCITHSKLLLYQLDSELVKTQFDLSSRGGVQNFVSLDTLRNLEVIALDIIEQTAIANYLDTKTTEIDRVVADKEALINLYEEEKKALINEAVTKGVTLSGVETCAAKLKPSGIDWLGEIPEHWDVKKIKHTTYLKARVGWKGLRSDEFLDEGFSYLITGTDIKDGKVDFANAYFIDEVRYDDDPFIQLKINDLLITKDGTIGKLAIVDKLDRPACLNSGVFILRAFDKKWQVKFLFFILSSNIFKSFIDYTSYGSTILHLYQNVFNEFQFPLPPVEEQTAIVHHIETETIKINDKINLIKQEIELLKEYRQALIFEAVTGKICVH